MKQNLFFVAAISLLMFGIANAGNDYSVQYQNNTKATKITLTVDQHQCTHSPADDGEVLGNLTPGGSLGFTWRTSDEVSQGCYDSIAYLRIIVMSDDNWFNSIISDNGGSEDKGKWISLLADNLPVNCNGSSSGHHKIECSTDLGETSKLCLSIASSTDDSITISIIDNKNSSGDC